MKIGILTYHRAHNYGAVMQAIATRYVYESMHHDVSYIDYWPDYHKAGYQLFSTYIFRLIPSIKGKIIYSIEQLINLKRNIQRKKLFDIAIKKYITPYCVNYPSNVNFDIVIYGSDQIWRKQSTGAFNPVYFADNPIDALRHVAYAASMGTICSKEEDKSFLKEKLKKFHMISVREESLAQLVGSVGYESKVVYDPTLLLSKDEWNEIIPTKRMIQDDYLLFYNMQKDAFCYEAIQQLAKSKGLKLIEIRPDSSHQKNVFSLIGPEEFISLIRYSSFIVTSSFHGLAFSIIYEKQFICSYSEKSDRAITLLTSLGLIDRFVTPQKESFQEIDTIKYDTVHIRFEKNKEESLRFIKASSIN